MLRNHPAAVTLLVFLGSLLLVHPFGNYPLNDDWQYAWVSWNLAKTGHFHVDVPIAPSLFLQALLGSYVIRAFGFSHVILRALTWVFCGLFFLVVDGILKELHVRRGIRLATLLLLCFNPLFFNLGNSFMTEIYGNALGFLGTWIWIRSRQRAEMSENPAALSWWGAVGAGAVFGASFWIRQLVVLLLPCLALATIVNIAVKRGLRGVRPTLPRIATAVCLGALMSLSYFPWAHRTGNLTGEFTEPLAQMLSLNWRNLFLGSSALLFYMTAFLFPLLLLFPIKDLRSRKPLLCAISLLLFACGGAWLFKEVASPAAGTAAWIHPHFPFLGNVIYDTGLGPFTMTDTYWQVEPSWVLRPSWGAGVWWAVTAVLAALIPLWAVATRRGLKILKDRAGTMAAEVGLFGFIVPLVSVGAMIQAYGTHLFDRYLFTGFVALLLGLAVILDQVMGRKRAFRALVFGVLLVPLAFFSVAGLHDYFRWNDARWDLVKSADAAPWQVLAGHEPLNWLSRTRWASTPYLGQDSRHFQVVTRRTPGYTLLRTVHIDGWLAEFPDFKLEVRSTR